MSLAFDAQSYSSLQSAAGLQASMALNIGGAVLVPQLNLNWLHEFSDDQRAIDVRFAEDLRAIPKRFQFLNQPPDRDMYLARLSMVLMLKNGVSAFATADKLLDHDYRDELGGSVGVRIEL
jgi:outer membrane autotransporter protein